MPFCCETIYLKRVGKDRVNIHCVCVCMRKNKAYQYQKL